jgi:hypothetical protein
MMRHTRLCLMALVLAFGVSASQAQEIDGHVLKANGQVRCEVVAPPEAGPVALFAGKELQKYLSQALGQNVPLLTEPSGAKTAIVVGRSSLLERAGVIVATLPRDGFVIKSVGSDLVIVGRDDPRTIPEKLLATSEDFLRKDQYERGTIYGVYEFLERFIGGRFYFPDPMGIIIPTHEALTLARQDLLVKPDHSARNMGYTGALPDGTDNEAAYPFKNRHRLFLRTQTEYIPSCHGLSRFDLIRRFGKSHPEYFALMENGQRYNNPNMTFAGHLCMTSGVKEEIYRDVEAFLTGQPAEARDMRTRGGEAHGWSRSAFKPGYVDLMPQDGFFPCHCPECQKYFRGLRYRDIDPKGASQLVWDFTIDIAERLKRNNVPGIVTGMAYSAYRDVPDRAIPDNMMVCVALRGPWNTKGYDAELKLITDWNRKLGRKVWLWNYIHKGSGLAMPGVPCITPHAVGAYYRKVAPHIFGAYMSSSSDYYIFQYLNQYVAHKVFWNNNADVDAILDEHHRLMFGKAAPVMAEAYDRFEANWLQKIVANEVETDLGPAAIPPSTYELWENIYSRQEIERLEDLFAKAQDLAEGPHRERVRYMRAALLEPLKAARAAYAGDQKDIAQLQVHAPSLTEDGTISVDGRLDDRAWAAAPTLHLRPFPASSAGDAPITVVRVLRDAGHLYIAFDCDEPKMDRIQSAERERDAGSIFRDSSVEIFLNPSGDRKHYRQIFINASGSMADLAGEKLGASHQLDPAWSSDARVAVTRRADGWSAEAAIPLKNLEPLSAAGFPANFTRNRILTDERPTRFTWTPFLKEGFHEIDRFGALLFGDPPDGGLIKGGDFTGKVSGRHVGSWAYNPRPGNDADAWAIDTAEFISGGKSLRLTGRKPDDRVNMRQSLPDLKPNTEYELSFFIKTENVVPSHREGGARISLWDERNHYLPENPYVGSIPWTRQRFTIKTSPNVNTKAKSYISLSLYEATGTVWYDDVRLTEKSNSMPSTP